MSDRLCFVGLRNPEKRYIIEGNSRVVFGSIGPGPFFTRRYR